MLATCDLQDEDVVCVVVRIETLRLWWGDVSVDLNRMTEFSGEVGSSLSYRIPEPM